MKKMVVLIMLLLLAIPLFSRPQFFLGGGVGWGRLTIGENQSTKLSSNIRYEEGDKTKMKYIADFIPHLELTVLPSADLGLGLSGKIGYGRVMGHNDHYETYGSDDKYSVGDSWYYYGYSFRTDSILDASVGLRYINEVRRERYLSFSASLLYNYKLFTLYNPSLNSGIAADRLSGKKDIHGFDVFSIHSLILGLSLMERYDANYFRIDFDMEKELDFSSFSSSSYRWSVTASFGVVFTILSENEFMR